MENSCDWYDVTCGIVWLVNEIKLWFLSVIDFILQGVVGIYASIPIPDFLQDVQPVSVPQSFLWASEMFRLEHGVYIVVGAYVFRFGLRRIPIIGA